MGNQEDEYRRAVASGDTERAVKAREAYVKSMEAAGQKPKDIRDM